MGYYLATSVESAPKITPHDFHEGSKTLTPVSALQQRGLRFYKPEVGRWLSKDPVDERGGRNLYGFCANQPLSQVDSYGLWSWVWDPPEDLGGPNRHPQTYHLPNGSIVTYAGFTSSKVWDVKPTVTPLEGQNGMCSLDVDGHAGVRYWWTKGFEEHEKYHVRTTEKAFNDTKSDVSAYAPQDYCCEKANCFAGLVGIQVSQHVLEAALLGAWFDYLSGDGEEFAEAMQISQRLVSMIQSVNRKKQECEQLP